MSVNQKSIERLSELVAFPTVSRESNLALIDWAEALLTERGGRCRRTWNADRTKANLLVSFGPETGPGVVLSGHTDVVPVDGQDWSTDPFILTEINGRLYGRGSADMKGFLAVCMACLESADIDALTAPIHLAMSYDEEVGCIGVDGLIEDLISHVGRPERVLIGEPTSMEVVKAHKSINVFKTVVTGQAAHSSQPHRGGGAIFAASRMIEKLYQLGESKRLEGSTSGAEPPYTTVQVGLIEGGTAVNILPARCEFQWEYRALPDEDPDEIINALNAWVEENVLPDLRRYARSASVVTEAIARVPPLTPSDESGIESWLRALPGVAPGGTGEVGFATEGGNFKSAGLPSIVCGPGSIDQAHQPDEFIEIEQLDRCVQLVQAIIAGQSSSR